MQRSVMAGMRRGAAGQLLAAFLLMTPFLVASAAADTLMVGPGQNFAVPSQAAAVAQPGDTVIISPSTYYDCAIWRANNLTIESSAPGVVLATKVCQGKAIFVIRGDNVTVRGITFTGAKSRAGNGAGIRAEGANLTVEKSTFSFDQDGILAGSNPTSTITIRGSTFFHDGACEGECAHGVYVGNIALLQVENTTFSETQAGHDIKSRAASTKIINCNIKDGPLGTSSYLIDIPNGGDLTVTNTVLEKGPMATNHTTAISIGEGAVKRTTSQLLLANNTFTNDGKPTAFVINHTETPAQLSGNTLLGNPTTPLVTPGVAQ